MSGASQHYSDAPSEQGIGSPACTPSASPATHRVEHDTYDRLESPPNTAAGAFGSPSTEGSKNDTTQSAQSTGSPSGARVRVCGLKSALKPGSCNPCQDIESRVASGSMYRNQDILADECPDRESWPASGPLPWDGRHGDLKRTRVRLKTEEEYMRWLAEMFWEVDSGSTSSTQ